MSDTNDSILLSAMDNTSTTSNSRTRWRGYPHSFTSIPPVSATSSSNNSLNGLVSFLYRLIVLDNPEDPAEISTVARNFFVEREGEQGQDQQREEEEEDRELFMDELYYDENNIDYVINSRDRRIHDIVEELIEVYNQEPTDDSVEGPSIRSGTTRSGSVILSLFGLRTRRRGRLQTLLVNEETGVSEWVNITVSERYTYDDLIRHLAILGSALELIMVQQEANSGRRDADSNEISLHNRSSPAFKASFEALHTYTFSSKREGSITSPHISDKLMCDYNNDNETKACNDGIDDCTEAVFCVICRDKFQDGNEVKEMPCKHFFHSHCILPWLRLQSSCPLCRRKILEPVAEVGRVDMPSSSSSLSANSPSFSSISEEEEEAFTDEEEEEEEFANESEQLIEREEQSMIDVDTQDQPHNEGMQTVLELVSGDGLRVQASFVFLNDGIDHISDEEEQQEETLQFHEESHSSGGGDGGSGVNATGLNVASVAHGEEEEEGVLDK